MNLKAHMQTVGLFLSMALGILVMLGLIYLWPIGTSIVVGILVFVGVYWCIYGINMSGIRIANRMKPDSRQLHLNL